MRASFLLLTCLLLLGACSVGGAPTATPAPQASTPTQAPLETPTEEPGFVSVDFATCQPQRRRVDVDFGSTTFEVVGAQKDNCVLLYGGEVESPGAVVELDTRCIVPQSMGRLRFPAASMGVDFAEIAAHCSKA